MQKRTIEAHGLIAVGRGGEDNAIHGIAPSSVQQSKSAAQGAIFVTTTWLPPQVKAPRNAFTGYYGRYVTQCVGRAYPELAETLQRQQAATQGKPLFVRVTMSSNLLSQSGRLKRSDLGRAEFINLDNCTAEARMWLLEVTAGRVLKQHGEVVDVLDYLKVTRYAEDLVETVAELLPNCKAIAYRVPDGTSQGMSVISMMMGSDEREVILRGAEEAQVCVELHSRH